MNVSTSSERPDSWNEAVIIMLHKKDKDPNLTASCHPESLLNQYYEVLAAIYAKRINTIIASYIHNSSSFIREQLLLGSTTKAVRIVSECGHSKEILLAFIDAHNPSIMSSDHNLEVGTSLFGIFSFGTSRLYRVLFYRHNFKSKEESLLLACAQA